MFNDPEVLNPNDIGSDNPSWRFPDKIEALEIELSKEYRDIHRY